MFDEFENKIFSFLTHGYPMKHRRLPESNAEIETYAIQRTEAKVKRDSASSHYALSSFRLQATLSLYLSFLLVNFLGLFILIGEEPNSLGEYLMYRLPSTIMGLQFLISQLMLRTLVLAYVPSFESSKTLAGWLLVSSRASIILGILFIFVTLFTVSYMTITEIWLTQYGYWFLIHLLVLIVVLISPRSKTAHDSLAKTNQMLNNMSLKSLMGNKNGDKMDIVHHDRDLYSSSPFIDQGQIKTIHHQHHQQQSTPTESRLLDATVVPSFTHATPLAADSPGSRENRNEESPEGGKRSKAPLRTPLRGSGHKIGNNKANPVPGRSLNGIKTSANF